jgi:hypothetical protein
MMKRVLIVFAFEATFYFLNVTDPNRNSRSLSKYQTSWLAGF